MFLEERNFLYNNTYKINESREKNFITEEDSYKVLYESELEWNDLTIKMIKLEHVAYINNDKRLLSEGIAEFGSKMKDFFLKLYEKIKEFINKIIASVTQFIANFEKVKNKFNVDFGIAENADQEKLKLTYSKDLNGVIQLTSKIKELNPTDIGASLQSSERLENFKKKLDELTSNLSEVGTKEEKVINQQDYDTARKFLFDPSIRKDAINKLKSLEMEAKKVSNEAIKAANKSNTENNKQDENEDSASKSLGTDNITACKQAMSEIQKAIASINKVINIATIDSVRIVKKASSLRKSSNKKNDENKKEENKKNENK